MTDDTHRIRVSIDSATVEVQGPEDFVNSRFKELEGRYLEITKSNEEGNSSISTKGGGKVRTLGELGRELDTPTKRDALLLVGWYLEIIEGHDDFTKTEVVEKAKSAKVELGANIPRDVSKLIEDGLLTEVGERDGEDTYYLTRTGEEHISEELGVEELL